MSGRYGWDTLGAVLLTIALILDVISLFGGLTWLSYIAEAILLYEVIRMFSRNTAARYKENTWFLNHTVKIRHYFSALQKGRKDRANHYYVCPKCGQIVRIPKGHGKVEIHCPKCNNEFTKRS